LTGAEGAVGWIVAWIPFYSEIKLGIMLWMVAPQTEVSERISLGRSYGGKGGKKGWRWALETREGRRDRATTLLSF